MTVSLISPAGIVIGTATSPTPGAPALLPGVQSSKGGAYQIVITGGDRANTQSSPSSTRISTRRLLVVAPNGSIGTATPIDPYANKFIGNDDRTAVLGSIQSGSVSFGDALVVEFDDVLLIDKNGTVVDTYTSPDFDGLILFDVALAKDNTFYVLGDFNEFTGVIVHMNLQGQTLGEFTMPVTDNFGYLSPEGSRPRSERR